MKGPIYKLYVYVATLNVNKSLMVSIYIKGQVWQLCM